MSIFTSDKDRNLKAQENLGEIIGQRDPSRLDESFATDFIDHDPAPGQGAGSAGITQFWKTFFTAFPDAAIAPQVVSADDDHVTVVLDVTGTHTGDFLGHAPTGKSFAVRGIQVARFDDGKIVERWGATDELGIMKQLGLV